MAVRHIAARHRTYHRTVHAERLSPPRPNGADQMAGRPMSDRLTGRYGNRPLSGQFCVVGGKNLSGSVAYDLVWPDDRPVLKEEREVARFGSTQFWGRSMAACRSLLSGLPPGQETAAMPRKSRLPTQSQAMRR